MSHSVKVTWENRLGDIGEDIIKSRLRRFSIPSKYDRDVGIDFYCELLEDDSPSLSFYVQAKGTEHFDDNWGASVKKTTIIYWLSRPFPVFLIVYDENSSDCSWKSIEDLRYELFEKLSKSDSATIYVRIDKQEALEKGRGKNNKFIEKIKEGQRSIEQFRGRPLFKGEGYVRYVPDPPRSEFEVRSVKENIRGSLYSLLIYYLFQQRDLKNAYLLGEFLTKFDRSHYNHFVWFGQINKELRRETEARKSFEEALRIGEGDKRFPKELMKQIIARIKKDIESCG